MNGMFNGGWENWDDGLTRKNEPVINICKTKQNQNTVKIQINPIRMFQFF